MSEVEGCAFDASGPVVAIDLISAGSCSYIAPEVDCKAQATVYGSYVNFTNPPTDIVWTVTGATIISGQGTWTLVVETDSGSNTTFQVQLQCIDPISGDNDIAIRTYTNIHSNDTDNVEFIGPDIVIADMTTGADMEEIDLAPLFTGTVILYELVGTWPAGIIIDGSLLHGIPTEAGTFTGMTVRAVGQNNADSNVIAFDVIETAFEPTILLNVPLSDVPPPVILTEQWPFFADNDFLLTAKFVVPEIPASTVYVVHYKWQNSDRALRLQFLNDGTFRMIYVYGSGLSSVIDADVNPTPGTTIEVKLLKSVTRGLIEWINDVKQTTEQPARTDPLDSPTIFDFHIGHFGGGGGLLGTAMTCVTIYSGDMTDTQITDITLCENATTPPPAILPYLDDYDDTVVPTDPNITVDLTVHLQPKTLYIEGGLDDITSQNLLKYMIVNSNGTNFRSLRNVQNIGHEFLGRGMTPTHVMEFRQYDDVQCPQGWGLPFTGTTLAAGDPIDSSGYGVKASELQADCPRGGVPWQWWVMEVGTLTTAAINKWNVQIPVVDASLFSSNRYAVIRDTKAISPLPLGELVKIESVDTGTNIVTVTRGYLSNPIDHPSNAYLAQIAIGDTSSTRHFSYNMATSCPPDSNGRRPYEYMPEWLTRNNPSSGTDNLHSNLKSADYSDLNFMAIMYDVDRDYILSDKADVANDGIKDRGYDTVTGERYYQDGMDAFHDEIKVDNPTLHQVGGTVNSSVFNVGVTGMQHEGAPTGFGNYGFGGLSTYMVNYAFTEHRLKRGPAFNHILFDSSTKIYDRLDLGAAALNSPYRMAMGIVLMEDGYVHQKTARLAERDPWYDEFAVNLNPNHLTLAYGQSADKYNSSDCLAARGWLGLPLENRRRSFVQADFELDKDILNGQGDFSGGITGWTNSNGSLSQDGNALKSTVMNNYGVEYFNAKIKSPSITIVKGQHCICFTLRASVQRKIKVKVGSSTTAAILCDTIAKKYVLTINPNSETTQIEFQVGRHNTEVWIEDVYLFEKSPDVFVREYENGIVILNLTDKDATVDLGSGSYQRILGINGVTGGPQDAINNGEPIVGSNFIVPARDNSILVRQQP